MRVVVQAATAGFLGVIEFVAVDGFIVSENGEFSDVPDDMLWEF
jgi:hypothetical protein